MPVTFLPKTQFWTAAYVRQTEKPGVASKLQQPAIARAVSIDIHLAINDRSQGLFRKLSTVEHAVEREVLRSVRQRGLTTSLFVDI
jgi:hypothetical protein